ncbi:MAG: YjfB family protein [Lachnospira eligens]
MHICYICTRLRNDYDYTGLSTNISTSGITNDIQIAMLKKNLDTVETAGADIAKMMEASVTPELGRILT